MIYSYLVWLKFYKRPKQAIALVSYAISTAFVIVFMFIFVVRVIHVNYVVFTKKKRKEERKEGEKKHGFFNLWNYE